MAARCFARARLAGSSALPLLLSLRRAVGLAATLRADDFFCAVFLVAVLDLAAAREAGFFVFLLAIPARPCLEGKANTNEASSSRTSERQQARSGTTLRSMQPKHAVDGAKFCRLDQFGMRA